MQSFSRAVLAVILFALAVTQLRADPQTFLETVQQQAAALHKDARPPTSLDDWQQRRDTLRNQLLDAWGGFPDEQADLEPRVLETLDRDGYRVEKILFQTMPGVWMTANAYVPDGEDKRPAVLCVHGHWKGAKQDPNVQARCVGLAKLGFFVLAVDAMGAGERAIGKALGEYHGEMTGATLLPIGRPLSGLQVYENGRAVDYLLTRPEVDGERLGITGASGGGNQTMYAGAWDDRFKAVVPVCSVGNYQAYLGAACCMCEVVPGVLTFTEEWGVLSLTAPRALMIVNASQDAHQFSIAEAQKSLAMTEPVFRLYDRPEALRHATFESPHAYNQPMREAMYGWMTKHLKGEGDGSPIPEPAMTLEDPETLRCYPGETRPDDWLTLPQFAAREGRKLVERFKVPSTTGEWETQAAERRQHFDQDVLGGTEPRVLKYLADVKAPDDLTPRKIEFSPDRNVWLTAHTTPGEGDHRKHRVLVISCDGADTEAVQEYVAAVTKSGRTAVTLELRATGQQAYASDKIGRAPDHNTAEWAILVGRPLLGQWVQDVRTAVTATPIDVQPEATFTVIGLGPAGLVAVCAAALDERIDHAVTVGTLASYITEVPYENQRLGILAPGIVREVGDVPHLAALMAPRKLTIVGSVTGGGETLDPNSQSTNFTPTQQVYELLGKENGVKLLPATPAVDVVRKLDE